MNQRKNDSLAHHEHFSLSTNSFLFYHHPSYSLSLSVFPALHLLPVLQIAIILPCNDIPCPESALQRTLFHPFSLQFFRFDHSLTFLLLSSPFHYSGILLQEKEEWEEALKSYQNAIRFRPRLAMAHLNKGIVLAHLGRKEEAIEVYKRCAALDGTGLKDPKNHESTQISALFNLGRLLADESKYEEAIKVYTEAVDRMPHYYQSQSLFNMMGEAFFKLGQFDTAEKWYRQALRVKSDHVPAHLTMAKLFAKLNKSSDAEDAFKTSKSIAPNDTSVYHHYGMYTRTN